MTRDISENPQTAPAPRTAGSCRHRYPVTDLAPHLTRLAARFGAAMTGPSHRIRPGLWHT